MPFRYSIWAAWYLYVEIFTRLTEDRCHKDSSMGIAFISSREWLGRIGEKNQSFLSLKRLYSVDGLRNLYSPHNYSAVKSVLCTKLPRNILRKLLLFLAITVIKWQNERLRNERGLNHYDIIQWQGVIIEGEVIKIPIARRSLRVVFIASLSARVVSSITSHFMREVWQQQIKSLKVCFLWNTQNFIEYKARWCTLRFRTVNLYVHSD